VEAAARDALVEANLDLVRRVAGSIFPRVVGYIELDELVALGNAGLVEAARRFDPSRGIAFHHFAYYRVQGAIVDELRRATALPRRVWGKLVALRAASEYLEHRGEREVGARQTAVAATAAPDPGATLAKINEALGAIRTMYVVSLEAHRDDAEPASPARDVRDAIDAQRFGARLAAALEALPDKERALVTKHYWEGKNLMEAGAELGISKSWASRLHAQAVERLRQLVADEDS
jgi:RNA polymerase sigma factor for flagellar operon FliA